MTSKPWVILFVLLLILSYYTACFTIAGDTLSAGHSLSGSKTLLSQGGTFELGFFQRGTPLKTYLGIWYKRFLQHPILVDKFDISGSNITEAVLGEDGNFVLRDRSNASSILWESFGHLTDSWLPGAKFWIDKVTGKQLQLISWKNSEDPAPGMFSVGLDPNGSKQICLEWNRSQIYWYSGLWNGNSFSLIPEMGLNSIYNFSFVSNENGSYFTYSLYNSSHRSKLVMTSTGKLQLLTWLSGPLAWNTFWSAPRDQSDVYALCGAFGVLYRDNLSNPCNCLKVGAKNCEVACMNNCSCTAYSYNRSGCMIWEGALFNLQQLSDGGEIGQDIYLKLAAEKYQSTKGKKWKVWVFALLIVFELGEPIDVTSIDFIEQSLEFPLNYESVSTATNNFSTANKLGEGGFGPVYKGKLLRGQEIAVKMLSKRSGQGIEEFRNETILIAKLQHKNLVRLLGCCIERDEKILIYEYMPNKSLDFYLFDPTKKKMLGWETCAHIIEGIAQGLLYLHQYSRLRIIHRDLKPSNILLDSEMNPKISDFGMARIVGCNETQANTNRIVGTYGYMSPEYAIQGLYSIKSDVFSFGVLLLEIISGKKNTASITLARSIFLDMLGTR
ncbi:hypothetical protein SLA2020_366580 [Shorea laevis]